MVASPLQGFPMPNAGGTDQVPADLLTLITAVEKQAVMIFASAAARDAKITSPAAPMVAFLTSPGKYTYYDPTLGAWADLMNPTAWDTWTPTLQSPGGVAQSLGSGATQIGRYRQVGKSVQFQCQWNFGSSITGPNGQLVFKLPPGLAAANVSGLGQTGQCSLYLPNQGWNFNGFWTINPGASVAQPHFPLSSSTSAMGLMANPSASDGTGGVPQISGTGFNYPLQPNGALTANGVYQIA